MLGCDVRGLREDNSSVIMSLVVLISSIRRFIFGNCQNNMRMVVVIILLKIFRGGDDNRYFKYFKSR